MTIISTPVAAIIGKSHVLFSSHSICQIHDLLCSTLLTNAGVTCLSLEYVRHLCLSGRQGDLRSRQKHDQFLALNRPCIGFPSNLVRRHCLLYRISSQSRCTFVEMAPDKPCQNLSTRMPATAIRVSLQAPLYLRT